MNLQQLSLFPPPIQQKKGRCIICGKKSKDRIGPKCLKKIEAHQQEIKTIIKGEAI